MKKLLALAALAATAPLFAAVESPNIVGYQNKEVRKLLSQQIVKKLIALAAVAACGAALAVESANIVG